MKKTLFTILTGLILTLVTFGQRDYTPLTYPCPGVPLSKSRLQFTRTGDINVIPCPSKSLLINGLPIAGTFASLNGLTANIQTFAAPTAADSASWVSSGSAHSLRLPILSISGTNRTNYLPFFNAANTLAKSDIIYSPTTFELYKASPFRFFFSPASENVVIGKQGSSDGAIEMFSVTTSIRNNTINIGSFAGNGIVNIGDYTDSAARTKLIVDDDAASILLIASNLILGNPIGGGSVLSSVNVNSWIYNRTITPLGTTGAVTINKPIGTVNIAAAGSSVAVTNSTVNANSLIFVSTITNDATCNFRNVVAAAGSFTIRTNAACAATTAFAFQVTN